MEARDTVIKPGELGLAICKHPELPMGQAISIEQAEISFKAGQESKNTEIRELRIEVGSVAFTKGKKAGIREVVETIDNMGLIEHNDSPLHETGATILDCPACCWYAYKTKLRELGITLP